MFSLLQFNRLYEMLAGDIVAVDCGIRCEQYCCRAADAVKYLLPGEAEYFIEQLPPNFQLVDHSLYEGYRSRDGNSCACTRALRPFCCRIFPFRPIIDLNSLTVIDLRKATGAGFDEHCWISEPLSAWRESAIKAWQFVLDDADNLNFYAGYALFLQLARKSLMVSTSSLRYEVHEQLSTMDLIEQWRAADRLFSMLGRPPIEWEE